MKILKKANDFYGKYLCRLIPVTSLLVVILEVFHKNDFLHMTAYLVMGFVSLAFFGFYMMSEKKNIVFFLIEIYMFIYIIFLSLSNRFGFSDLAWQIFICLSVFSMSFILMFNRFYKSEN